MDDDDAVQFGQTLDFDIDLDDLARELESEQSPLRPRLSWVSSQVKPLECVTSLIRRLYSTKLGILLVAALVVLLWGSFAFGRLDLGYPTLENWLVAFSFLWVSFIFRELGYAAAYAANGIRPRAFGIAISRIIPMAYCEYFRPTFIQPSRRAAIALCGVASQGVMLAIVAAAVWLHGNASLSLAELMILIAILVSLNPLVRGDGYEIASAALNVLNLHEGLGRLLIARVQFGRAGVADYFRPAAALSLMVYAVLLLSAWTGALVLVILLVVHGHTFELVGNYWRGLASGHTTVVEVIGLTAVITGCYMILTEAILLINNLIGRGYVAIRARAQSENNGESQRAY